MSDYNVGGIMVRCCYDYLAYEDSRVCGIVDQLAMKNMEIKILSDLINEFSHAKQEGKGINFTNETLRRYIAHVHKNNPTIFGDLVHGVPEADADAAKGLSATSIDELLDKSLENVDMSRVTIDRIPKEQIDAILAAFDSEVKALNADLSAKLMETNRGYDLIAKAAEQGQRGLQHDRDLKDHINRKMGQ